MTFRLAEVFPLEEIMKSRALGPNVRKTGAQWLGLRVGPQSRYVAVYPNGKVLVTGCRTVDESRTVLGGVARMLASYTVVQESSYEPVIQNIVATSDLGRKLDLALAARMLADGDIEYEPEQFPGIVLRLREPPAVVLFFGSGKFVVTGTKSFGELDQAVHTAITIMSDLAP